MKWPRPALACHVATPRARMPRGHAPRSHAPWLRQRLEYRSGCGQVAKPSRHAGSLCFVLRRRQRRRRRRRRRQGSQEQCVLHKFGPSRDPFPARTCSSSMSSHHRKRSRRLKSQGAPRLPNLRKVTTSRCSARAKPIMRSRSVAGMAGKWLVAIRRMSEASNSSIHTCTERERERASTRGAPSRAHACTKPQATTRELGPRDCGMGACRRRAVQMGMCSRACGETWSERLRDMSELQVPLE